MHLFPELPGAPRKATRQFGQRKLRAWGAQPSPTSLLGSGTERPLPGYGASLLHQQIVSIPFLQELPRAPRKGDAKMGPQPRPLQSLGGSSLQQGSYALKGGQREAGQQWPRHQGIFLGLLPGLNTVQGVSQPLPSPLRCRVNSIGPRACFPPSKLRQQRELVAGKGPGGQPERFQFTLDVDRAQSMQVSRTEGWSEGREGSPDAKVKSAAC